ncbi:MAG TPA: TonB-dependent receptor, partial [Burkholderiales bacterium]|nr:TonB-dependent receptor [Burkholderiales bacterium]
AESGGGGGAEINVVSKSGTNQFHGSAFEFLRNDKLNARSPFDPSQLPAFHLNQFGANVGGPIARNKTFFFANYEGLRQRLGQTLTGTVPSASLRSQVVAASPALKLLIDAYPAGVTHLDPNYDQFRVQSRSSLREDSGMIRVDHKFNDNTTMFARYTVDDGFLDSPSGPLGARDTTAIRPSNLVLQLMHVFSPTVINEAKTGMNRSAFVHPVVGIFPQAVEVPGLDTLPNSALDEEIGTTFSWMDTLTVIRGRHTWKLGVDIRRIRLNNSGNAIDSAGISYAKLDDFIHNRLDAISVNTALGIGGMRRTFWMGFGQDEIKVRPNLTLNLGLRYEYYSVMHEVKDRAAVVDLLGCGGFCPPGTPYYSPDRNNFAPRVGVAWSPARLKGKTVIRAGFGVYYGAGQNDDFSDPHESTASRLSLTSDDVPNLSYPITRFLGQATTEGVSPKGITRDRRDLYYENWDFLIQQQLPHSFVGQVGYVGSEGHKLFTNRPVNLLDPVTRKRPNPTFGQFGVKRNDANNNFNALQATLQRHFTGGWLWQTQYMWSHAISDGSVGAGESIAVENASCRACDRSDSSFDVRHTITMNSIYQLPFGPGKPYLHFGGVAGKLIGGWALNGLATASTGRPVNILVTRSAGDLPDGNRSNQRPDLVAGVPIYPSGGQTIRNWFNLAAFKVPAKGTWGNAGRNIARGPGLYEIDLGLEKRTLLTEHTSVSLRAEAFNLFNHPIYANPFNNISTPARFGQITNVLNAGVVGTGTPRRLQFMLRL